MAAKIIDGKAVAKRIRGDVAADVERLAADGMRPRLAAVLVGEPPAGRLYAQSQEKQCNSVGIEYELCHLPESTSQTELIGRIDRLNADPAVTGIMLHLPLPEATFAKPSRISVRCWPV